MAVDKSRRTIFAWSMYDFANQPYTTLIITFIYSTFFASEIVGGDIKIGQVIWSRAIVITALIVAFLSPIMGAIADRGGYRKLFLMFWTYVCIIGSFALYYPLPGEIYKALFWVVISNVGFEMGGVFCNAYLPEIAPKNKIGRISGYGWSFGYLGGLIALFLALVLFINPEVPAFGFSNTKAGSFENIRAINLMVAIWFLIFSIPVFLFVGENKNKEKHSFKSLWTDSFGRINATFKSIKKYKILVRFLVARLFYNDALITIFAFGGIYAKGVFDFTFNDIFIFGIVLNVTAGIGAFSLGFLDDIIGGKKTIQLSNIGLIIACIIAVCIPNKDFFTINLPILGQTIISGRSFFWLSGILIGIFSGPNQAASRSLMARFIPEGKENEFFGFFAFTGKATAFIGPLFLGIITTAFDSQRLGVFVVVILFIIGFLLMHTVDEKAGISQEYQ